VRIRGGAGRLRHIVVVERPVQEADGQGGFSATKWVRESEHYASIEPLRARERVEATRVEGVRTHRIRMRYREIPTDRRIRSGERVFEIDGTINVGERDDELHVFAVEVEDRG